MKRQVNATRHTQARAVEQGRVDRGKAAAAAKRVWSIRTRLQIEGRARATSPCSIWQSTASFVAVTSSPSGWRMSLPGDARRIAQRYGRRNTAACQSELTHRQKRSSTRAYFAETSRAPLRRSRIKSATGHCCSRALIADFRMIPVSPRIVLLSNAEFFGHADKIDQGPNLQFLHHSFAVDLDSLFDNAQISSDLLVKAASNDMHKHLALRGVRVEIFVLIDSNSRKSLREMASLTSARDSASNRSLSSTGFVKKSIAPALMARTLVGMSPLPVRKTIGR